LRAAIFDVEDVIARTDRALLANLLEELVPGVSLADLSAARHRDQRYVDWELYSVGRLSSQEYWSGVMSEFGVPPGDVRISRLREGLEAAWWGEFDADVLKMIANLRSAGYRVGLLSNSAPEHDRAADVLAELVDAAQFSHRAGVRKPDEAAYMGILGSLGVSPHEAVFVDDKARNTEAAERMGIRSHLFTSPADLARFLAACGLGGV
jgi:putative hydrolase of the HAD superfamily